MDRCCPVCEETGGPAQWQLFDYIFGKTYQATGCGKCELVFLTNPPHQSNIAKFYDSLSGKEMHHTGTSVHSKMRSVLLKIETNWFKRFLTPSSRVMDLGCGTGDLSVELAKKYEVIIASDMFSSEQWGHEDIPYVQCQLGSDLSGLIAVVQNHKIDTVVMRHVLEHVLEPKQLLQRLTAAGVRTFLICVPNFDSRLRMLFGVHWFYWFPVIHMQQFNRKSLQNLFEQINCAPLASTTYGIDEVITSLQRFFRYRYNLVGPDPTGLAGALCRALKEKGIAASLSSALSYPISNTVIRAAFKVVL